MVKYIDRDSGESRSGKIISRAGKTTGANKHTCRYNMQYTSTYMSGKKGLVDMNRVDQLETIESLQLDEQGDFDTVTVGR